MLDMLNCAEQYKCLETKQNKNKNKQNNNNNNNNKKKEEKFHVATSVPFDRVIIWLCSHFVVQVP